MPKRGVIAFITTVLLLGLLLSFKTPDDRTGALGSRSVAVAGPTPVGVAPVPSARTNAGPTGTAAPSAGSAAAAPPSTGTGQRSGRTPTPTATPAPPTAAAPTPPATGDGQIAGPVISTRYGPVQVQVTLSNGAIVDIAALALPTGRRSGQISNEAAPILRDEALQAQSATIDIVTGATYTSDAYARSLQAALDKAHG